MRLITTKAFLCLVSVNIFLAGCSSDPILVSRKEVTMPPTGTPLTAIRYYLPIGKVEVSAKWDQLIPGWDPQFKVIAQADPNSCYSIDRDINSRYDDEVSVSVDPTTGLLASVNATSTDQTVNALGNLAAAASSFASFGVSPAPKTGMKARDNSELKDVISKAFTSQFNVIVSPSNPRAVAYVVSPAPDATRASAVISLASDEKKLVPAKLLYAKFVVTLEPVNAEDSAVLGAPSVNASLDGIAIRIPVPYYLVIAVSYFREDDPNPRTLSSKETIILPDQDHDYFLPIDRIPLVTSSTKVVLVNGMVQSLQRGRPSTFAAILGVPKTLIGDLIPIPFEIHQSQTSNVQASGHSSN
jgi:hypothetical protein